MPLILRPGDQLPTVVALQILLNRYLKEADKIAVTGHYDSDTTRAVRAFQKLIPYYGGIGGEASELTWQNLLAHTTLRVRDAIDVTDTDMCLVAQRIRTDGEIPIVSASQSGRITGVIEEIIKSLDGGTILLLRFTGHGSPGVIGVSDGKGLLTPAGKVDYSHQTSLDSRTLHTMAAILSPLRPFFEPFGSVELHGCMAGHGMEGISLLRQLADIWNVPVSAPTTEQRKGFMGDAVYRYTGSVQTQFPGGGSLESWAASQPEVRYHRSVLRK